MTWDVREVTAPTVEPVTLTEARLWCRIDADDTTQDAVLLLLVRAARERAEHITGRKFARRQLELRLDAFPADDAPIVLPYPPLYTLDSITYATGGADVAIEGSPQGWTLDVGGDQNPARVSPLVSWPSTDEQVAAVRVRYTVGYASASLMPASLRLWIQARISTWYEQREHLALDGKASELPRDFVDGLLDGYRARSMFA